MNDEVKVEGGECIRCANCNHLNVVQNESRFTKEVERRIEAERVMGEMAKGLVYGGISTLDERYKKDNALAQYNAYKSRREVKNVNTT
jgi:hypothetical protein